MSSSCEVISPQLDPGSPNLIPISPPAFVSSPASSISLLSLYTDDRARPRKKQQQQQEEQPISPINGRPFIPGRYPLPTSTRPIPIRTRIHPTGSTPGSPHLSPVSAGCTPTSFNLNKVERS